MNSTLKSFWWLLVGAMVWSCLASDAQAQLAAYQPDVFDAAKVIGPSQCLKCHANQVGVLQRHPHFTSFQTLHRLPAAKRMAAAMGEKSVKRSESCMRCHYTYQPRSANSTELKAIAGISCESCHGPAQDWLLVHNDYGGPAATKESESAEHRLDRLHESIRRGMRPPSHLYALARSCFRCHIIDDEQLVNTTEHPIRSANFNLASWSQGSMRHNYLRTDGRSNALSDPQRRQMMHVISKLTEMEYSLRAAARSTSKAQYAFGHAQHAFQLRQELSSMQTKLQLPQLQAILEVLNQVKFSLDATPKMQEAADQVSPLIWELVQTVPGEQLEPVAADVPPPIEN